MEPRERVITPHNQCLSWVIFDRDTGGRKSIHVRSTPNSDRKFDAVVSVASCQEETLPQCRIDQVGLAYCFTLTGSMKEKVEPLPTTESTQMRPPCISMMRFDMASPKPVPPFLRVIELSAC